MLQLKEPEDYDPKYKKWTLEDLPIFFPDWAAVPAQGKSDIVRCVKSLLPQADSVIHAGDVDDEGQLIVDELLRYCGYRGKVQRLYTSDTSTAALKKRLGMVVRNDPDQIHVSNSAGAVFCVQLPRCLLEPYAAAR